MNDPFAPQCASFWGCVNEFQVVIAGALAFLAGLFALAALVGVIYQVKATDRRERRRRDEEVRAIAAGLAGEVDVWVANARSFSKTVGDEFPKIISIDNSETRMLADHGRLYAKGWTGAPTPILEANIGRIGVLDPTLAGDMASLYDTVHAWRTGLAGAGISDLDPPAVFAHDMVLRLVVLHRDCSEVVDLARRLHAIARGEPDPGQDVRFEPLDINSLNVEFTLDAQTETASATIRDAAGNLVEEMTWSLEPSID